MLTGRYYYSMQIPLHGKTIEVFSLPQQPEEAESKNIASREEVPGQFHICLYVVVKVWGIFGNRVLPVLLNKGMHLCSLFIYNN